MRVPNNIADLSVAVRRIVIGSLLALHALAVAVIFLRLPIHNADDIWNVELWGAWRPFSTEILLPRDTYVLHAPINIAARLILGDGLASLAAAPDVVRHARCLSTYGAEAP